MQGVAEVPNVVAVDTVANGGVEEVVDVDAITVDANLPPVDGISSLTKTEEDGAIAVTAVGMMAVGLEQEKTQVVPGHACSLCDRVFMSMQGLRSHERSHSAMALINRADKYSCQYCQFQSPFRHK